MNVDDIIKDFPKGLLNWYPFKTDSSILQIIDKPDSLTDLLKTMSSSVTVMTLEDVAVLNSAFAKKFDYIVTVNMIERALEPAKLLDTLAFGLASGGRLLLGADNRLGLKYFCGDRDPFTNQSFDGIEKYRKINKSDLIRCGGRNYSRFELAQMLDKAGLQNRHFLSVFPNLSMPQIICSENFLPNEDLGIRIFPRYHHPDSVFLEEQFLYTDLIRNGLFHQMANSFLIECTKGEGLNKIDYVTVSMDRGKEHAMATVIQGEDVVKKPLYPQGLKKLENIMRNADLLEKRGLNIVKGKVSENAYTSKYVQGEVAMNYLRRLARTDADEFNAKLDMFVDEILKSSIQIEPKDNWKNISGPIFNEGFLDLVPLNSFYVNGKFIFFDQEFCEHGYPAKAIIFRSIVIIFMGNFEQESLVKKSHLWNKYGLEKDIEVWRRLEIEFIRVLRNTTELRQYIDNYQIKTDIVMMNRRRVNYSDAEYRTLFVDFLRDATDKKLILFGSGNYALRFLALNKGQYEIHCIVDNNPTKWGTGIEGIPVRNPNILKDLSTSDFKVVICVKRYMAIARQLFDMDINTYGIYDPNVAYTRPFTYTNLEKPVEEGVKKKYKIGYVAGVFDLFHVGHLNILKRAKEQCEHLIVGVVSDEGVITYKKTTPFIPFDERLEIVQSCQYVDQAVQIPFKFNGTTHAYEMYRFDCQFSGSDYENDPSWLAAKAFLQRNGSDLVFFPYTKKTSSSMLKKAIKQALRHSDIIEGS
ncbi:adenylyltransferase/cytidyltransferase family protein [Desulfobacter curvatus]|uniref:adenylyltransferase/cytidyltransferase family protein n=1 Tax=Desulfobacter curvatus TaxID=2290 RepID=UPI000361CC5D|nr:adenylyltransferase/cytidyltransferase family protein [Desulfobacter curvatus]